MTNIPLLTGDVARLLELHPSTVVRLVKQKAIPCQKTSKGWNVYLMKDILTYKEKRDAKQKKAV